MFAANAGDPDQAEACVDATVERFGSLDILVNNAATNPYMGPTIDIDLPRYDKTFEVNLRGPSGLDPTGMASGDEGAGGVVLNIASIGGLSFGEPPIGIYNDTKAALIHLTRTSPPSWRRRCGSTPSRPGLVKTDLARALWEPDEEAVAAHDAAQAPRRAGRHRQRRAVPGQRRGSWITGEVMVVDGGALISPDFGG